MKLLEHEVRDATMVFGWFSKRREAAKPRCNPVARLRASSITYEVKADLWANIFEFEDLPVGMERHIYAAALRSVMKGRASHILKGALMAIGVPARRAAEITHVIHNRATSKIMQEKLLKLGITEARWLYSGAACTSRNPPSSDERLRDAAHKAMSGRTFPLTMGMLIDGRRVFPGREPGCKCLALPIAPLISPPKASEVELLGFSEAFERGC